MKSHETKFKTMSAELLEHRSSLPEKKVKGKEYEELKQKEEYLEFEVSWETFRPHPQPLCPCPLGYPEWWDCTVPLPCSRTMSILPHPGMLAGVEGPQVSPSTPGCCLRGSAQLTSTSLWCTVLPRNPATAPTPCCCGPS